LHVKGKRYEWVGGGAGEDVGAVFEVLKGEERNFVFHRISRRKVEQSQEAKKKLELHLQIASLLQQDPKHLQERSAHVREGVLIGRKREGKR
jgi:hypothetical protein